MKNENSANNEYLDVANKKIITKFNYSVLGDSINAITLMVAASSLVMFAMVLNGCYKSENGLEGGFAG